MFINKGSEHKKLKNNILALASVATEAKKLDSSVINSTTGMMKNEDGSLYEFSCVEKVMKTLTTSEKFAYANSSGSPAYKKAVLVALFGKYLEDIQKDCFLECIPTPGGTGGLNLAFTNYVDKGETVLLPNHMWENYLNYAADMGFNTDTYSLFNDAGKFDIDDLNKRVDILEAKQDRVLILINDPCENPTGFCMEDKDYDNLLDISKKNKDTNFIYLIDVAYYDFYNTDPNIIKSRYAKFKDLPSNALALFVFSGSKSFGLYGLRIGALVALSRDEQEIATFKNASTFSCRAKWSAASTLGISVIKKLILNEEYAASYQREIKEVCAMLEKRSVAFLNAAKEVGLKTLPYEKGFFICVPCDNPEELMIALHEDGLHAICTKSCLRIALCAINKEEAARVPAIIKKRMSLMAK